MQNEQWKMQSAKLRGDGGLTPRPPLLRKRRSGGGGERQGLGDGYVGFGGFAL